MEAREESPRASGPQTFWSIDRFMGVLEEIGLSRICRDNCVAFDDTPMSKGRNK